MRWPSEAKIFWILMDAVDFATTGVDGALRSPVGELLRDVPWSVPLVVASAVNVTAILCYEIVLIVKRVSWARPCSRRRIFLEQLLLFGLLLSSLSGFAFAVVPSSVSCAVSRLVAVAHSIVLSTILVEFIFLRSLSQGIFLPGEYLAVLAAFAITVQVGISTAWIALRTLQVTATSCGEPLTAHLAAHIYPALLLVAVVIFSLRLRVQQARRAGMAVACEVLVAVTTTALGLILGPIADEACVAFGVVAAASGVFVVTCLLRGRVDTTDVEFGIGSPSPSLCNCKPAAHPQGSWELPSQLPPAHTFKPLITVADMSYNAHPQPGCHLPTTPRSLHRHQQACGYGPPGALYYCVSRQLTPPPRPRFCQSSVLMY